jgi:CBS-domain-containing membrane protein
MLATSKPFLSLTAADLMTRSVVTIPREFSLQGAARLLSRAQVTGAPVVDAQGRCIGVLSATDFVHWAEKGDRAATTPPASTGCVCSAWQMTPLVEGLPEDSVGQYMTANPVTVTPDVSIVALAQMMLDAHIHRIIVVNEEHRPVGIVSSTDVLAAVARSRDNGPEGKRP